MDKDRQDMVKKLAELPAQARELHKENKKVFSRLRKRPPKNLDQMMLELHNEEFSRTDCLHCANCCKTTGPLFTNADISRISKKLKMKPGKFIDTFLRIDEEDDYVLQQLPCPFLGEDNACSIYDFRPKACREFPHTDRKNFHQIANLSLKNVEICPAAFNIVERMKERLAQK